MHTVSLGFAYLRVVLPRELLAVHTLGQRFPGKIWLKSGKVFFVDDRRSWLPQRETAFAVVSLHGGELARGLEVFRRKRPEDRIREEVVLVIHRDSASPKLPGGCQLRGRPGSAGGCVGG